MPGRNTWKALQAELARALSFLEAGDHARALAAVDAALAIDPDFLAAQALRDRILSSPVRAAPSQEIAPDAANHEPEAPPAERDPEPVKPLVSTPDYAKFEQRVRRRRVDRKIDEANAALDRGKLSESAAAIDEVQSLDANTPELSELTERLDTLRRAVPPSRRGGWLAAAAVLGGSVLGGVYFYPGSRAWPALVGFALFEPESPNSPLTPHRLAPLTAELTARSVRPASGISELIGVPADPPTPQPVQRRTGPPAPVVVVGAPRTAAVKADPSQPAWTLNRPVVAQRATPLTLSPANDEVARADAAVRPTVPAHSSAETSLVQPGASVPATPAGQAGIAKPPVTAQSATVAPRPAAAESPASNATGTKPAATEPSDKPLARTEDDDGLVREVLQRYRRAYAGLDAQLARKVWPQVDEVALARAFDGLRSQQLTFDDCNLKVDGEAASATCHGSTRYVPKVGSHDPRIEPRVWNFSLRKKGAEWTIASARAER